MEKVILAKDEGLSKLEKKSKSEKTLRVLSLFSGCGGMDLGFEGGFEILKESFNKKISSHWAVQKSLKKNWLKLPPTRFKTVFANDIRPGAMKVWSHFFPNHFNEIKEEMFHLESIVGRVKRYWDGDKNLFPKNVDVVTGGFPCQDFSVAGKRRGFNSHKNHCGDTLDEPSEVNRGKLYMWMREVIDITHPKVFIAENVKGIMSLGEAKNIIQNDFKNIGESHYIVLDGKVLFAADYGVPQSRERVFFIGFRRDALKKKALKELNNKTLSYDYDPYPLPTHSKDPSGQFNEFVHLNTVFNDLLEPEESEDLDQRVFSKCKWYGKHCQGNREVNLTKIGPTVRAEHHGNIEFRRLARKNGGKNDRELDLGMKERRLTIRECCRIQTFPDDFRFVGDHRGVSTSEAYKLIGNAVPPLLAFHIAKKLELIWDNLFKK